MVTRGSVLLFFSCSFKVLEFDCVFAENGVSTKTSNSISYGPSNGQFSYPRAVHVCAVGEITGTFCRGVGAVEALLLAPAGLCCWISHVLLSSSS